MDQEQQTSSRTLAASPETVAAYIAAEAQTAKPWTISRRVAAIRYAHKLAGIQTPTDAEGVKATMRGIRRTFGGARNKKAPAVAAKMLGMVATAPDSRAGLRDRALLLLGFAGAFRRSEFVALNVANIEETETGLLVRSLAARPIRSARAKLSPLPAVTLPARSRALREWLQAAGIEAGPIFRPIEKGGKVRASRLICRSVANIVKAHAGRAGFDAARFPVTHCGPAS